MASFIEQLPRVYCIEVTDTAVAYPLGLRNGDVIIQYGDWLAGNDLNTGMDEFYVEAILQANNYKGITLLRHHPETKSSEIVTRMLPSGKTSDLGFYPHKIYYTQREAERLYKTCEQYSVALNERSTRGDTTVLMALQNKGSLISTIYYHVKKYLNRDPAFLLYLSEKYGAADLDIWSVRRNSIADWESQRMFNPKFSGYTTICLTHDLEDLQTIIKKDKGNNGLQIVPIKVSHDVFQRLMNCYEAHVDEMPDDVTMAEYRMMASPDISEKQLYGKWNANIQMDDDGDFFVNITLNFDKKAGNTVGVDVLFSWKLTDGVLDLLCASSALWNLEGVCLDFDFAGDTQTEVKLLDLSESVSESDMTEIQESVDGIRSSLAENFHFGRFLDESSFIITDLTKDKMVVRNGTKTITFTKIK